MLRIYAESIKGLTNSCSTSVLTMSPLITVLVIMLLTVVYNESQYVTDYQDVFQKAFKKSAIPLELCHSATQRRLCEISSEISLNRWRQLLKDNDVIDFEDEDLINDEIEKNVGIKRQFSEKQNYNIHCGTVKRPVELGDKYFPKMLSNVSCLHTAGEYNGNPICLDGSNCQPVTHMARVLTRRTFRDTTYDEDIPQELKACWKFADIPIHVGCKCARS